MCERGNRQASLDILPVLKGGDSFCKTAMSRRENVAGRIAVALMHSAWNFRLVDAILDGSGIDEEARASHTTSDSIDLGLELIGS